MFKLPIRDLSTLYKVFTGVALVLLIWGAFYSCFTSTMSAIQANNGIPGEDMVSAWEKRLRKSRLLLPNNGIIGYMADWDLPDKSFASKDQQIEFLLSQYTLAPLILVRGTDHKVIFGNFGDTGDPTRINKISSTLGIELITTASNEFFIFQGTGR
jgi:hypothetical protein